MSMNVNLYPIALASPSVNLNLNPVSNPIPKKLTLPSSNLPLLTYGGQDP